MPVETLNDFTERFAKAVGCQSHCLSKHRNNLKKSPQRIGRGKNVLGWVRDYPRKYPGWFRVSTYAEWADDRAQSDAYEYVPLMHFGKHDGLVYWIEDGNAGQDFRIAARGVRSVLTNPAF